jgi:hypothetical protein
MEPARAFLTFRKGDIIRPLRLKWPAQIARARQGWFASFAASRAVRGDPVDLVSTIIPRYRRDLCVPLS